MGALDGGWRRRVVDVGPLAVVLAVNTLATLSTGIALWWGDVSDPASGTFPRAVERALDARPEASDADVHSVLWFAAGLALVWALRRSPRRVLLAGGVGLWMLSGMLEFAQRWVPSRTPQWVDVVGNGVGIAAGITVGVVVAAVKALAARSTPTPPEDPPDCAGADAPSGSPSGVGRRGELSEHVVGGVQSRSDGVGL